LNHRVSLDLDFFVNDDSRFGKYKEKAILNEIEVTKRIESFPFDWLKNIARMIKEIDYNLMSDDLKQISEDFFRAKENSLL